MMSGLAKDDDEVTDELDQQKVSEGGGYTSGHGKTKADILRAIKEYNQYDLVTNGCRK